MIRFLLAPVLFMSLAGMAAAADDFSATTPVFAFLPTPNKAEELDKLPADATEDLTLRPNQAGEFYLYAFNPSKVKKTYIVELRSSRVAVQTKVTIPDGKWVRVRLPKPAPPPPPVPAATPQAAVPGQPVPPPPEPLPPGSEVANSPDGFNFTLRLLNEDGTAVRDAVNDKPLGHTVGVSIKRPDDYIAQPEGTVTVQDRITSVEVLVEPKKAPAFSGMAVATLDFPPQPATLNATIRKGQYRRTLIADPTDPNPKAKLTGSVENAGPALKMNVGIDGVDRAFIYRPDPKETTAGAKLIRDEDPAVRVFPAAAFAVKTDTQPVAGFPVRVEADNDPKGAKLELRVRRVGLSDADAKLPENNEIIRLGGAREEQVWIDVAGPTDAGVLVSTRSRDWLKVLDLQPLRGAHEVMAALKYKDNAGAEKTAFSIPLIVNVDASGPEAIVFGAFPKTHVKGTPLAVTARAADPETDIVKAIFFVGKPTEDGKIAPDAIKVDGVKSITDKGVWTAAIPLPPEKRGEVIVGVQFFNKVGLATMQVQTVVLIDPPPPSGTIEGVVVIGEIPQPDLAVALRAADGKEIGRTTTGPKGKFKFEKVPVGVYAVLSAKKDSAYGTAGVAAVEVKANETAKPTVTLVKQVK